jgi:hypothetical protein
MPEFYVEVVKKQTVSGKIRVEAEDSYAAVKKVRAMMNDKENTLQTTDDRISWEDPEYDDDSFTTYVGVQI